MPVILGWGCPQEIMAQATRRLPRLKSLATAQQAETEDQRVGVRLVSGSGSEVPPLHSAMGGTVHSILGEQIPSSTPKRTLPLHFRV